MPQPQEIDRDSEDSEYDRTEESPLLANNELPADVVPDTNYQRTVLALCMIFLVVLELGAYLQVPPSQQIMEGIICHEQYPEYVPGTPIDERCKGNPDVAGKLAMIRGWQNSFDCIPPLLTSLPYGVVADKYGRRPVLFLSVFGLVLEYTWMMVPLIWHDVFPLWTIWFGSIFQFIGGGSGVLVAIIYSMVADTIPIEGRTTAFYRLVAVSLIGELVTAPLSAFLMSKDPWIAMILGLSLLYLGTALSLFVPETLDLRKTADAQIVRQLHEGNGHLENGDAGNGVSPKRTVREQIVFSAKNDMSHVWNFLLGSKSIMPLIISFTLSVLVRFAKVELILQYTHERFNWDWETSTLLGTVGSITNIVMLVAILPALGWLLATYTDNPPVARDLWLARMTGILMVIGCLLIAFAFTPWILVGGLVFFSMGAASFGTLLRAVLNTLVEPHTIAVLNTTISVVEMTSLLVSAPTLSALLKYGIASGGVWIGLPFMAATVIGVVGVLVIFLYKLPAHLSQPVHLD